MTPSAGSGKGTDPGIDLSQFAEVFFEEASEHLASMESLLLEVSERPPDDEDLNAIFRAAHSIKGGAAMFGFQDVTELTHDLESVLDDLRKHELDLSAEMIETFLQARDLTAKLLAAHHAGSGGTSERAESRALRERMRAFKAGASPNSVRARAAAAAAAASAAGTAAAASDAAGDVQAAYARVTGCLVSGAAGATDHDVRRLAEAAGGTPASPPAAPAASSPSDYGFFDESRPARSMSSAASTTGGRTVDAAAADKTEPPAEKPAAAARSGGAAASESSSIRVAVE